MLVRCACGWEKEVKDELRGKSAQCPKCGAKFALQPADVVAVPEPEPVSLMPAAAETDEEDAWLPPGLEADDEEPFEAVPLPTSPPKPSPWKTPNLQTLRERVKGHYPAVASGAWYLEFYAAFARVAAIIIIALAGVALVVGVAGLYGMFVPDPKVTGLAALQRNALLESMTWNGLSYFLTLIFASVAVLTTGAVSRAFAELSVAWAAGLAGQQISPCGGLQRRA